MTKKKPFISAAELIVKRLDKEIESSEILVNDGDPFLISRMDYLQNLKFLRDGTLKT